MAQRAWRPSSTKEAQRSMTILATNWILQLLVITRTAPAPRRTALVQPEKIEAALRAYSRSIDCDSHVQLNRNGVRGTDDRSCEVRARAGARSDSGDCAPQS